MTHVSQSRSLEFWTRLIARLNAEFDRHLAHVSAACRPREATVDTAALALEQVGRARDEIRAGLGYMEQLQVTILALTGQVSVAAFQAGIQDLDQRILCVSKVVGLFEATMGELPYRQPFEQELEQATAYFQSLRNAGHSDALNAERQRLSAVVRSLPVVGREDGAPYEEALRTMQTSLDELEAERQLRAVSTLLAIQVSEAQAGILRPFGLEFALEQAPVEAAPAVAEAVEPAQESAANG